MPPDIFDSQIAKTFRASRYAERMCQADAALLDQLREGVNRPLSIDAMHRWLGNENEESAFHQRLRTLRRYAMVHTIHRDINALAPFAEVVGTVSALADVTLAAAQQFHTRAVAERFALGSADAEAAQLLIVGMGKLGGRELNVSSDIDLVFVHADDGDANGHRSWHEFHAELGKRIIRAIDHVDADGFVFRVDMRLRPFGASGPLVSSLAALENYFITQARPWERYAWLKGRAITGAPPTIAASALSPQNEKPVATSDCTNVKKNPANAEGTNPIAIRSPGRAYMPSVAAAHPVTSVFNPQPPHLKRLRASMREISSFARQRGQRSLMLIPVNVSAISASAMRSRCWHPG